MRAAALVVITLAACSGRAKDSQPPPRTARAVTGDRVAVRIDTSQADAVLAMLAAAEKDKEAAWRRMVATDGFRRLAAREESMKRTIDPQQFRAFVESPELGRRAGALATTLARWRTIDLSAIAARVFAYLPADARLEATIYPVIKPKENSFVFFDDTGAAIFMYVDPTTTTADVDNTIAHELHHIGYASLHEESCTEPPARCAARTWAGAFGEGMATLAAAGGPDVHPRATSKPELRAHWDREVVRFDDQLREVEVFLRDVGAGRLDEAAARERGMTFFGLQGPWYTVGWVMAVAIERCAGRPALIEAMRRPWTVLRAYNDARDRCPTKTAPATVRWDPELLRALDG